MDEWIRALALQPHPEGGFYRETFRSAEKVQTPRGPRSASTAIYYLLDGISAFHRVAADELWHVYEGELELHVLGTGSVRLGRGRWQGVVPAGSWQAAEAIGGFALCGCTVAPGFEFADWELGRKDDLLREFPSERALIERLTR
jgi:predicted cupin superfamily sugar epimerase